MNHETQDTGRGSLLEQALARGNMAAAWQHVKANGGSAGVDDRTIEDTKVYLTTEWPRIREELRAGTYRPLPVRRVHIPKPGGGHRELGIPTVIDRLIQQALLQVMQPLLDPTFSKFSYGFRPGRSPHDAVRQARRYVQDGYRVVVDVDLEKFFDRVNHDILMNRLSRRIGDQAVLRLIRRYLRSGVEEDGVVKAWTEGTPQGGPLSPLLANVLLDEVDRSLEERGHRFVRYADDLMVYVRSQKAGERVLGGLRKQFSRLRLKINEDKTAVDSAFKRKFLGFRLWGGSGGVKLRIAPESVATFKRRIRQYTRRVVGRNLNQVIEDLQPYIRGWRAYYGVAETPGVLRRLDQWVRRRLRALQFKHWKRASAVYRALPALGASSQQTYFVARNTGRWWRFSRLDLARIMPNSYFDARGLPRLF